ncbi:MAG: ribosome hibernation-promoting factor, HPF/YfiA family [Gammaproteobacteria bacterium]
MQINISGHHVEVTDSLRNYITSKMERIERHFDQVLDAHIVLDVNKLIHKSEITIHVSGNTIHAESENEDMYSAIDSMLDKLDRQVKKHKEKLTDHHRREGVNSKQHWSDE